MPSTEPALAAPDWSLAVTTVAALSFAGALAAAIGPARLTEINQYFLVVQDAPVLFVVGLFLVALGLLGRTGVTLPLPACTDGRGAFRFAVAASIVVAGAAYGGTRLVYYNFALTTDELMAVFDARIIAAGRLLAPVAPEWRDYLSALQPKFILAVPENAYWISSYLPMNAALRALFALLGDAAWTGPVLAGVAAIALFGVARRLWPDRADAAVVAVILLVSSSQFLFTAMTPYAMTAHLALNMVWLWLFLRDTRGSHAAAIGVAFVACGLHQIVFHPLFAAPFIVSLLIARRWRLAACYCGAYAAIGLFWIFYWSLLLRATNAPIAQSADVGMTYLIERIAEMIQLRPESISLMGLNAFRFLAWQNPIAIPLAAVGLLACRGRTIVSLAAGIALTLVVMLILLPFQGHGWGYRYLHGFLGSLSLIAAQGWICLTDRGAATARQAACALGSSVVLCLLLLLPWRAFQIHAFVKPYASAYAAIRHSDAEVIIIDSTEIWYGTDIVRNDPFLRASPKLMELTALNQSRLSELCRRYDVAVFGRADAERFGLTIVEGLPDVADHNRRIRDAMRSSGCGRPALTAMNGPRLSRAPLEQKPGRFAPTEPRWRRRRRSSARRPRPGCG
jgi:hypothetical protein